MLRRIFVTSAVILLLISQLTAQTKSKENDLQAVFEVLGLLNQWRLEEGLAPFRPDSTLDAMALYQAQFLISKSQMPNGKEMHVGRNGEGIIERAHFDTFEWSYYGRPEMITIGEIAAVNSAEDSIAFWKSSKVHHDTVVNPAYREIGIAAIPHVFGHVYIAVLGSRPNVFPALVHPETGMLYLTQERSPYAPNGKEWIAKVEQIRLFDEVGRPLQEDWTVWTDTLKVPEEAGDKIYLWYTNGMIEAMTEVDLKQDIIVLPGYLPASVTSVVAQGTAVPTSTREPQIPEVLIVYDKRSLAIINQSRKLINLGDLELEGKSKTLSAASWAEGGDVNIYQFPPGDCMQVWSGLAETGTPSKPQECRVLRRVRSHLTPNERFWTEDAFDVLYDGDVIATCEVDAKRCEVELP